MPQFKNICKANDIPEGTGKMFVVDDHPIGIFHIAGEFYAIDNRCPHAGASLARGIIKGDTVACRIHHWRFCLRDGKYLDEDQPRHNLRCYRVRVIEGEVQVEI